MSLKPIQTDTVQPQELRIIYEISRVILQAVDTSSALKEIIHLSRPVFIFDNVVLFQQREDDSLEPTYALSVGRGRGAEADMAWGEAIALQVLETGETVIWNESLPPESGDRKTSRLNTQYFLGLPLWVGDEIKGALVFVRFGGPDYLPEQVNLAGLIAEHIQHLLQRQLLVGRVVNLEAQRQLDRLQQEFVATISHNLRTPLGFIKGYATTLLRDEIDWDDETRREFLNIIDDEADRLSEMIDNLLDSSRLQSGTLQMDFQAVKLETLLKDFFQRAQLGDYDLNLSLVLEPSQNSVRVDPTRMIQVFDNLVANAAKYAPASDVSISLTWLPQTAQICIRDRGPGIPADELENIFRRFYRLNLYKNTAKGSGLGLYICRQIIDAHNGKIFAESVFGEGTAFYIYLPLSDTIGQGLPPSQENEI